jgi:hypothetical protein
MDQHGEIDLEFGIKKEWPAQKPRIDNRKGGRNYKAAYFVPFAKSSSR